MNAVVSDWGSFPVSGEIQHSGGSKAFTGSVSWRALPADSGATKRDVLLSLHMTDASNLAPGNTVPGGGFRLDCKLVDDLAANVREARLAVMDRIQKEWSRLEAYEVPYS